MQNNELILKSAINHFTFHLSLSLSVSRVCEMQELRLSFESFVFLDLNCKWICYFYGIFVTIKLYRLRICRRKLINYYFLCLKRLKNVFLIWFFFSNFWIFCSQISGYLVAIEVATVQETCSHHDLLYLGCGIEFADSVGIVFPASSVESRLRHNDVHWGLAARFGWDSLLSRGKCFRLLSGSNAIDFAVLHFDLDKSVKTLDSKRLKRRSNGSAATEVKDESCQNVDCRCHSVCALMAAIVFDFCTY